MYWKIDGEAEQKMQQTQTEEIKKRLDTIVVEGEAGENGLV